MGRRRRSGALPSEEVNGGKEKVSGRETPKHDSVVKIAGYVALQLPPADKGARWIYLRQHAPGVLFIANLPLVADIAATRRAVPAAGQNPEDIVVQLMPGGRSRFARIRLRGGEADVSAALAAPFDWLALDCFQENAPGAPTLPEQWLTAYWKARDLEAVQKWSAATMDTFERIEKAKEEREKAEAEAAAVPDDDGFVVVRRGASAVDTAGASANAFSKDAMTKRTEVKKKRTKGIERGLAPDGFYRWQRRAGRKRELEELRKQFEGDKKRVAAIRQLPVPE